MSFHSHLSSARFHTSTGLSGRVLPSALQPARSRKLPKQISTMAKARQVAYTLRTHHQAATPTTTAPPAPSKRPAATCRRCHTQLAQRSSISRRRRSAAWRSKNLLPSTSTDCRATAAGSAAVSRTLAGEICHGRRQDGRDVGGMRCWRDAASRTSASRSSPPEPEASGLPDGVLVNPSPSLLPPSISRCGSLDRVQCRTSGSSTGTARSSSRRARTSMAKR